MALGIGHKDADQPHPVWLRRARRKRPGDRGAAEEPNELAALHCQRLPCFGPNDSTPQYGRRLLRCGISLRPMSAMGLGCAKTPAVAPHVEISLSNFICGSQIILHKRRSTPCRGILFYTFPGFVRFYN